MKTPGHRGAAIDLGRYNRWTQEFSGYRHQVPEGRIREWIEQFSQRDRDIAARILDSVDFVSNEQLSAAYSSALKCLEGWNRNAAQRSGRWRFVPYSASAGESGDSMLHKFRVANNLSGNAFNDLFIYRSEIVIQRLGFEDTVVLVDDFVGTGDQVCQAWDSGFSEILAEVGKVYLIVVAARDEAIIRIADATGLAVVSHITLHRSDNVFAAECVHFNEDEKKAILRYCKRADETAPKGYGDCGLLVVFGHGVPNNSIPILHRNSSHWNELFRRFN